MNDPKHVGILFGGKSAEHEVSILSAQNVSRALHQTNNSQSLLYISPRGQWLTLPDGLIDEAPQQIMHVMQEIEAVARKGTTMFYHPSQIKNLNVIFPILHGTYGEDGTIQAFLEMLGVPYVGSGILGSAIGMDKDVMKRLLRDGGLPIVPFKVIHAHEKDSHSYATLEKEFGSPFFIKPAGLGSSIGVHKVSSDEIFRTAMADAFTYDTKVLIEKAVSAREIECSVLGNHEPTVSILGEIVPNTDFYSYESKYVDPHGAQTHIPAKLDTATVTQIQALAVQTFRVLEASGLARIDFFVDRDTNEIFINEINTLPGFTAISMYPTLWEASGVSYPKLVERLLILGIERFEEKKKLRTTRVR